MSGALHAGGVVGSPDRGTEMYTRGRETVPGEKGRRWWNKGKKSGTKEPLKKKLCFYQHPEFFPKRLLKKIKMATRRRRRRRHWGEKEE